MNEFLRLFWLDLRQQLGTLFNLNKYIKHHEFRLISKSIIIGVVVWSAVLLLKTAVHELLHWTFELPEIFQTNAIIFLPLLTGALLVALLSYFTAQPIPYTDGEGQVHNLPDIEGDGVERAIALYYSTRPSLVNALKSVEGLDNRWQYNSLYLAGRKMLATFCTVGLGGSGGLEASVVLVGEALAAGLFRPRPGYRYFRLYLGQWWSWWQVESPEELQTLQLCGIAAAVATLLDAPLTGAFFATEVMYRRTTIYQKFFYTVAATMTAHLLTVITQMGGQSIVVHERILPPNTLSFYLTVMAVGVTVALVSLLFTSMHYAFNRAFNRVKNIWLRFLLGATLTGMVAMIAAAVSGQAVSLVLGPGDMLVNQVLDDKVLLSVAMVALIGKLLATSLTVSSGGSAGLLVSSLFFGSMVATIFARLTGEPIVPLAAAAMAASLVALVKVPISSLLFVVEIFGSGYLGPVIISMLMSSLVAYDNSIYRTQRDSARSQELLHGYSLNRIPLPQAFYGKTIRQLDIQHRYQVNVVGIIQPGNDRKIAPWPDTVLSSGDELVLVGSNKAIQTVWHLNDEAPHATETTETSSH